MQDRFKFRCWHKPTKEMFEVISFDKSFVRATPDFVVLSCRTFHRKDCELIQCTGLKDKNGKLIYEGDIAKECNSDCNMVVKYGDYEVLYIPKNFETDDIHRGIAQGFYMKYKSLLDIPLSSSLDERGYRLNVIGNIYENKELLND